MLWLKLAIWEIFKTRQCQKFKTVNIIPSLFNRLRRDKPPPPPPHLPPVPEGEPQYPLPPQQTINQQGPYRTISQQGPHAGPYNGGMYPGMRQPLPGQSPQMFQQQVMGYSPRSPTTPIPMGPGSNRSVGGSSIDSYPPPLQRPGPGQGPPHASVRMVAHPHNPNIPQQHVHPGSIQGMRMQQAAAAGHQHPAMRRPSSSTSDMYTHAQHPQMIQPQRSASTIPYPSPPSSQGNF